MKLDVTKTATPLQVSLNVTFDASDNGDQPFRVDWGDGSPITSYPTATHTVLKTYAKAGNYHVLVQANDSRCRAAVTFAVLPGSTYDLLAESARREALRTAGQFTVTGKLG